MSELTAHEVQLNNARINLRDCVRMIEEMLHDKSISPEERKSELGDVINKCHWAVDYLFRAQEELKVKP